MSSWFILIFSLVCSCLSLFSVAAEPSNNLVGVGNVKADRGAWYAFTYENDAFGLLDKNDDGYTSGMAGTWGYAPVNSIADLQLWPWLHTMADASYLNLSGRKFSVLYAIAQGMYTPTELEEKALIEDDRPYAGTLTWKAKLYSFNEKRSDNIALTIGIAGPASLAEFFQKVSHEIIDAQIPQGWDNQIKTEPLFQIRAEHIEHFLSVNLFANIGIDSNFLVLAELGNLRSDVGAGVSLRFGTNLDETYAFFNPASARGTGLFSSHSGKQLSWQIFTSAVARYVFNDITLDGNTFRDSHSVDLIHDQGMVSIGSALRYSNWSLIFSAQRGSDTFDGQVNKPSFGAITINYYH